MKLTFIVVVLVAALAVKASNEQACAKLYTGNDCSGSECCRLVRAYTKLTHEHLPLQPLRTAFATQSVLAVMVGSDVAYMHMYHSLLTALDFRYHDCCLQQHYRGDAGCSPVFELRRAKAWQQELPY